MGETEAREAEAQGGGETTRAYANLVTREFGEGPGEKLHQEAKEVGEDIVKELLEELFEMKRTKQKAILESLVYWDKEIALKIENVLYHYRHFGKDWSLEYDPSRDPWRRNDVLKLLLDFQKDMNGMTVDVSKATGYLPS